MSLAVVMIVLLAVPTLAQRVDAGLCRSAIAATERTTGVPDRLMQAISIMESGRRDPGGGMAAWPWTINVEGVGEVYESKAEVIAAVLRHRARGARSIDVGCMQVNLLHHADAFASLDEAFDPAANARYAAHFLQQLLAQTGSWPRAVAGYHSLTPDIGADYARKVLAIWAQPESISRPPPSTPAPVAAPLSTTPPSPTPPMPGAGTARIIALPGHQPLTLTGRTLDSYRAIPLSAAAFRRF